MIYIFLDTNIFLHFRFFVEIPWHSLFGEPYQIVLAPVVVDELDKHKRNPNGKIASRARKVLGRFEDIVSKPTSFPLQYLTKRPSPETFQKFQLDRQEQDDCILATIVEFGHKHNMDEIIFISNDTGPRFRASSLEIKTGRLPEDLQDPSEISDEQKQIQTLIQENNKLKNAKPKVFLAFENDTTIFKAKLTPFQKSEEEYIASQYEDILEQYPDMEYEDPNKKNREIDEKLKSVPTGIEELRLISQKVLWFNQITKEQVESYNQKLNDFFHKYREYLKEDYKYKKIHSLTVPIDLKMYNEGNAPAVDIDIWLHFPDGFELLNKSDFPGEPSKPTPPHRPTSKFDIGESYPNLQHIAPVWNIANSIPDVNLNKPDIRKSNSYEVNIHYESLKHFQSVSIDTLLIVFRSVSEIINWKIDYKIIVGNVPEPFSGCLSVVIGTD